MPPELHLTYRSSRSEVIGCLATIFFWVAIGTLGYFACIACNPVYHDASMAEKILMVVFIEGTFVFFTLFSFYATIRSYYYRLIFDENGITENGIWRVKTIRISEITEIKWYASQQRIKLRTLTTQITIAFDIFRRDKERTRLFIVFLRESVPFDRQKDWKQFCHRMENSKRWRDKNTIPVPDSAKGEMLYTRKMFNRTIIGMIIGSIVVCSGFAYFVHFIHENGYTIDDLPQGKGIIGQFIFYICVLWLGWIITRFGIPKNGKMITKKHLWGGYYTGAFMMLVMFGFPFSIFFLVLASKSDNIWGQVVIFAIHIILFLPMFWIGYQQAKDKKYAMESLPDDYMPKIFEKDIEAQ